MEEPGELQSMGLLQVGHDWATSLSLFTFTHWRRKWQPTPVFLSGESQGQGSLVDCHLWGRRVGHNWSDLAAAEAAAVPFISSVSLVPEFLSLQNGDIRNLSDFPGGPVVKIRASNAGGSGSILEWGIKIPHDSQHGQKIKNKKKTSA